MKPQNVPPRQIHPPHILRTLERLAPDRPPTPWDTKVERLLNGLRQPHLYIGRTLSDRALWLLDLLLMRTHAHILGGTGSGKTRANASKNHWIFRGFRVTTTCQ